MATMKIGSDSRRKGRPGSAEGWSIRTIVGAIVFGFGCFYVGVLVGFYLQTADDCTENPDVHALLLKNKQLTKRLEERELELSKNQKIPALSTPDDTAPRFPNSMSSFVTGMAKVDRMQFATRFDMGVPLDEMKKSNREVLMIYSDSGALPTSDAYKSLEASSNTALPMLDVKVATENCDKLNVILAQTGDKRQCFAMMGQFPSYHIQKYMRLPIQDGAPLNSSHPLRYVNRGAQSSGRKSAKPPQKSQTLEYWKTLPTYIDGLQSILDELSPLAQKVARDNTVVVMVCNHGQSELLMNFACSSRARGLDISTVLVFATDQETKELAEGLGMTAFFDKANYGNLPKKAAGRYADRTFTAMMMAKVYCVQMTVMLGYDVLFSDVDMIWFKDPLEFFHDKESPLYEFDAYFQDDGARGIYYAPYSANTGFYYIRNNDRTRNFFNSLLLAGDLILSTHSHQIALVSLLNEHASMYGLRVKVLSRNDQDFPGGFNFHRQKDFMKSILTGTIKPYIFHMSWTENKKNKRLFFRQMNEWYLQDKCTGTTSSDILGISVVESTNITGRLIEPCCVSEPIFECSYKDKPSFKPCPDSPPIDHGGKSFW